MKVYLASGYSVMKCQNQERKLRDKFHPWRRLISFFDLFRGNPILVVMEK